MPITMTASLKRERCIKPDGYNRPVKLIVLIALALVVSDKGNAQEYSLPRVCDRADAIVIGLSEAVSTAAGTARFTLTVDTVLKGDVQPASSLAVAWPGSVTSTRARPAHYRALWFLRRSDSGLWWILPIGGPKAPIYASGLAIPAGARFDVGGANLTVYGKVWSALATAAPYTEESPAFLTTMETLLRDDPASAVPLAPGVAVEVRDFRKAASVNLRGFALAFGIRAHDTSALDDLAAQLGTIGKSQAGAQVGLALYAWRGTEPAAILLLGKIARADGCEALSRPAANALMMIHTKEAVPQLVQLLAAKDAVLQDIAVRGLSLFVRGAPVVSAANSRSMAYLAGAPSKEYLDDGISPYVTIAPVPPESLPEHVLAWNAWWNRVGSK